MNERERAARIALHKATTEHNNAVDIREALDRRMRAEIPAENHTLVLEYALATLDMNIAVADYKVAELALEETLERAKLPFWKRIFQL